MSSPITSDPTRRDSPTERFEAALNDLREARRRRAHHRRVLAIVIPVVLALLAATFVLTQRNVTTTVSLERATAGFRATLPEIGDDEGGPAFVDTGPTEASVPSSVPGLAEARDVDAAPEPLSGLPAEGVYAYRAQGGEKISVFGAHHDYPERVYATVRHLGGCRWEHRLDVIEEHVDRRHLCTGSGQLMQVLQSRSVEFFGRRDGVAVTCDPAARLYGIRDEEGAQDTSTCRGDDGGRVTLNRTSLGARTIQIGSRTVPALYLRLDATFTGKATGSSVDELWIAPENGMTLRWDREVDTLANAAFGAEVRYQEKASFVLEALTPRR